MRKSKQIGILSPMQPSPLNALRRPDPPIAASLAQGLRLTAALAVFAQALTPLVINGLAYDDAFFGPKWAWIAQWTLIGLAAHLGAAVLRKPFRITLHPAPLLLVVYVLLNLWSTTWARSQSLAYEQTAHTLWIALAAFAAGPLVRGKRSLLWIAWIWIGVASLTAVWVLWQDFARAFFPSLLHMKPNLPDWRGWLAAGLGNTNHIGDLLALALLPALMLFALARRTLAVRASFAACILLAAGLTVCWSVGSNLGLFAGGALMAGLIIFREGHRFFLRRSRRWLALLAGWGAVLLFVLPPHPLNPHRQGLWSEAFGSARWHEGGPTRVAIWAGTLEIIREHPWAGVGGGNFTYAFPEAKSPILAARPDLHVYQGKWTNAAHNIFLEAWAELGILGLFALLAILIVALHDPLKGVRHCPRSESYLRITLAALVLAWAVQGQMNFTLQHPTGALTLATLLVAIGAERSSRRSNIRLRVAEVNGPIRTELDFIGPKHLAWVGVRLEHVTPWQIGVACLMPIAAILCGIHFRAPIRAQAHYRLAREAKDSVDQEAHLLEAISLDPNATGTRSYYSEWLVQNNRPDDALDQLKAVRRRLNSTELFDREARAYEELGKMEKAKQAHQELVNRLTPLKPR